MAKTECAWLWKLSFVQRRLWRLCLRKWPTWITQICFRCLETNCKRLIEWLKKEEYYNPYKHNNFYEFRIRGLTKRREIQVDEFDGEASRDVDPQNPLAQYRRYYGETKTHALFFLPIGFNLPRASMLRYCSTNSLILSERNAEAASPTAEEFKKSEKSDI